MIHTVWAIGQLLRSEIDPNFMLDLDLLLDSNDPEIQVQVLRVISDIAEQLDEGSRASLAEKVASIARVGHTSSPAALLPVHPRVRLYASLALGKLRARSSVASLFHVLEFNVDTDPTIRHGVVMGLVGIGDVEALVKASEHTSSAVRLAVAVALRRLGRPEIATFLSDADPAVVLEAARAINDVPIDEATQQLAALAERPGLSDALVRRVLNANFRLGRREHADAVAALAADARVPESLRLEALAELDDWSNPPPLDRVNGAWRPLEPRSAEFMADVIRPQLGAILSNSDALRKAGVQLAARYGIKEIIPVLRQLASDEARNGSVRVEALKALEALRAERLADTARNAVLARDAAVRAEGRRLLAKVRPEEAVASLREALQSGESVERQGAVAVLASMESVPADAVLSDWLDRLAAGGVPAEIQLDLIEAARRRGTPEFLRKLEEFEAARPQNDHLAKYRECLAGGDAARGEQIFFGRSDASCRRCHKVDANGGEVGPDLSGIGLQKDREYLLESLVDPNRQIAKGFESVTLVLTSGKILVGMIRGENEDSVRVMAGDGETIVVPKDEIDARAAGKSAMPADLLQHLSKSDIRDLVEYLITRRTPERESARQEHQ
jgi:quinoprotein glucose dehydrogenase